MVSQSHESIQGKLVIARFNSSSVGACLKINPLRTDFNLSAHLQKKRRKRLGCYKGTRSLNFPFLASAFETLHCVSETCKWSNSAIDTYTKRSLNWISEQSEIHIHFCGPTDVEAENSVILRTPAVCPIVVKEGKTQRDNWGGLKSHERLQLM